MIPRSIISLILAASCLSAADDSLVGLWKLNRDKGAETSALTIRALGNERYTFGSGEHAYDIRADGKPTLIPMGNRKIEVKLSKEDASTWKMAGPGYSMSYRLKNEHTLEVLSFLPGDLSYKSEYERSEARTDLGGPWRLRGKTQQVSGRAQSLEIRPAKWNALSVAFSTMNAHYSMTLDGKEYTVEGDWPNSIKATGTATRIDANTILETRYSNGKQYETAEYKVSPDRQTLTMTTQGKNHREIELYERQKP